MEQIFIRVEISGQITPNRVQELAQNLADSAGAVVDEFMEDAEDNEDGEINYFYRINVGEER